VAAGYAGIPTRRAAGGRVNPQADATPGLACDAHISLEEIPMRHVRRFTLAVVALAMFFAASATRAQVLPLVPSEAMVVIKIKNMQDVSSKIATLSQQWGLANIRPELNDPLGTLLTVGGLGPGLNRNGEAAIALMMPAAGASEPDVVVLVPVSDFKAFAGALPNNKTEGEVTTFNPGGKDVFAVSWGQYAAVSPKKELLAQKGGGIKATTVASKELDTKDVTVYANLKQIRGHVLPMIQQNKGQMLDGIAQAMAQAPGANPKYAPVLKAYLGQFINVIEGIVRDGDAATFGISLSKEGISTTLMGEFQADSYAGKAATAMKNSNASFTAGLPQGKYFMFGGFVVDQTSIQLMNDFVAPIEKEMANLGADAKPLQEYVASMKDYLSATKQANFGMVAPAANAIQQTGAVQMVTVVNGDSAKMVAAQKRMLTVQDEFMKLTNGGLVGKTTVTPDAKNIEGVTLTQFRTAMNGQPKTPEEQQAMFIMQMLYGQNGMTGYTGAIGADKVLGVVGGNDQLLASAVQAAKSNADELAKGPAASVIKALPAERRAAVFVSVDTIASTVLDVMAARGMPGGVKLPPNLPPLAAAIDTEGTAIRLDGYVPAQTVQALIAAGMQMWLQNMQGGGAGQPGGL
jgi:hypothetical protein